MDGWNPNRAQPRLGKRRSDPGKNRRAIAFPCPRHRTALATHAPSHIAIWSPRYPSPLRVPYSPHRGELGRMESEQRPTPAGKTAERPRHHRRERVELRGTSPSFEQVHRAPRQSSCVCGSAPYLLRLSGVFRLLSLDGKNLPAKTSAGFRGRPRTSPDSPRECPFFFARR